VKGSIFIDPEEMKKLTMHANQEWPQIMKQKHRLSTKACKEQTHMGSNRSQFLGTQVKKDNSSSFGFGYAI